jgi:multidrug efflux pump subunit AcrA (membrane-fusion protein)
MNYGVKNAETIRIERAKTAKTHEKQVKSVLVKKVKNTKIRNKISSTGRAVSLNNITISSEVQGRLVGDYTFKKGTELNKGKILFTIKNTDLKLLIEAKKSEFMSLLSANLADISLDFNNQYIKWINFFNAIDLKNNLPPFPKMSNTKEKNYIISRSILSQYLSIKSDEERLNKYTVKAPFDGIITKSYSDVGGNVNPGSPVVDFIRKGEMEIELTVNTSEIEYINIGDDVIFKHNRDTYLGKVVRKGRFVNKNTQNISVFSSINTSKKSLYSGMYLNATIITKGTDNTFNLPVSSIFDGNKVFIVDSKNKLKIKEVNILTHQNNEVIIDNIADNTLIVSEPLLNVTEGSIVKAILK